MASEGFFLSQCLTTVLRHSTSGATCPALDAGAVLMQHCSQSRRKGRTPRPGVAPAKRGPTNLTEYLCYGI